MIVIRSVLIILAIGLIVLAVVAHQVIERKTDMGRNEINACRRTAAVMLIEIAGACQAVREIRKLPKIAFPVAPHRVAVAAVPFSPIQGKVSTLVTSFSYVPWIGLNGTAATATR